MAKLLSLLFLSKLRLVLLFLLRRFLRLWWSRGGFLLALLLPRIPQTRPQFVVLKATAQLGVDLIALC